jgi:hypothetical protein
MRLAATKPAAIFPKQQPVATPRASVAAAAAGPCSEPTKKNRSDRAPWRIAVASSDAEADGDGGEDEAGAGRAAPRRARGRRARLSARRRERVRLPDGVSGGDVGEFLRHPDSVDSLLNTGALESFAPAGSGAGTFTCALRRIGFLGFEVAPVLDLRVAPTSTDCTIEMLSCRVRPCDHRLIHRFGLAGRNLSDSCSCFPHVFAV